MTPVLVFGVGFVYCLWKQSSVSEKQITHGGVEWVKLSERLVWFVFSYSFFYFSLSVNFGSGVLLSPPSLSLPVLTISFAVVSPSKVIYIASSAVEGNSIVSPNNCIRWLKYRLR